MPLGTEVGLGPDDIVLDGDRAPPLQKGTEPPIFGPCLLSSNGWMDQDETWHARRPRFWPHCFRGGPISLFSKGHISPIFGPYLLQPNGWMDQDATWYGGRPRPRRLCDRWRPSYVQKKAHPPHPILAHVYCVKRLDG